MKENDEISNIDSILNSKEIDAVTLSREYSRLAASYKSLLRQTNKLIKISDATQNKLKAAQESLAFQNNKINKSNKELKNANSAIERYLTIINSELDIAAEYVRSLLPQPIKSKSICTNWKYEPSRQLGGDAFGYHWIDDENFAIYLFDVCGHGVGPALHSVTALHALRFQILPGADFSEPSQVLTSLNESFQMKDHNDMYFTIWYGVYNKTRKEIKYAAAGHHAGFLVLPGNNKMELHTRNLMIGVDPDFEYTSNSVKIDTPSSLFLFSDGVFEFELNDGLLWTIEELHKHLLENQFPADSDLDVFFENNELELDNVYTHIITTSKERKLKDDFSLLKVSFL